MEQKVRVASFFSGIGGFDLGFERAGMKVVFQSEINDFCRAVLKKHWPKIKLTGDIRHIQIEDISTDASVWCAGFPCQDVSLASQGKRAGLDGDRSGLFFSFTDLIGKRKPRFVVLENVIGLLNSNKGEDFRRVLDTLDGFGYVCAWRVLDAQYFRTPQRRRRVIIVASLGEPSAVEILLNPETVVLVQTEGANPKKPRARGHDQGDAGADYVSVQHGCIGRRAWSGPQGKGWRRDGKTWTLDSRGSSDVICSTVHPFGVRETTGIPERLDGRRYRAVGNAIPVQITTWLGKRIMHVIERDAQHASHVQDGLSANG